MIDDYNKISDAEILKYLAEHGIIDQTAVAKAVQMANKDKFLNQHPYNIWLASDGYWKTKFKDNGKLRTIKRRNKEDIEDAIVEYYRALESEDLSFKARYYIWIDRQVKCGRSDNTILKYESDYRRFFAGYPIEEMNVQDINEEVLSEHILMVLKDKKIPWRAFKDIMGYVNGVFQKCVRDRVMQENPCDFLDLPIYRQRCYIPPVKTTKQRTLTDQDIHILLDKLHNPRAHNANVSACFAVEMALYTGMRVGELAGLMWQDVILEEGVMLIRRSEKFDRKTKESFIAPTKTGKERIFPITDQIEELLKRVKSYEDDNELSGEFVFQDKEGRLTKSKISDAVRNYTMSDEFSGIKSIHAIRRTFNSKLKKDGASTLTACSLLGHSERVNEQNYTYDLSELEEKRRLVTQGTRYS